MELYRRVVRTDGDEVVEHKGGSAQIQPASQASRAVLSGDFTLKVLRLSPGRSFEPGVYPVEHVEKAGSVQENARNCQSLLGKKRVQSVSPAPRDEAPVERARSVARTAEKQLPEELVDVDMVESEELRRTACGSSPKEMRPSWYKSGLENGVFPTILSVEEERDGEENPQENIEFDPSMEVY